MARRDGANIATENIERIIVAVDGSPQSVAALHAAATLASLIGAELCGLFVEDQDLQKLCALPFSAEVGAYSATVRQLTTHCIPREFRARQNVMEASVEAAARGANVPWSFQVSAGSVNDELLAASERATIFGLGRSGHVQQRRLGSTARKVLTETTSPVLFPGERRTAQWAEQWIPSKIDYAKNSATGETVVITVYTGTETADRALEFAARLAQRSESELHVLIRHNNQNQSEGVSRSTMAQSKASLATHVASILTERALATRHIEEKQNLDLFQIVQSTSVGVLVLPLDYAEENRRLFDSTLAPVVLVS